MVVRRWLGIDSAVARCPEIGPKKRAVSIRSSRTPQNSRCLCAGFALGSHWFALGSHWFALGSHWFALGSHWFALGSHWFALGSHWARARLGAMPFT